LRGLAVDSDGTVYAAATGCHRVVRITRDGKVEVVLKAERPWSPTGVAVHGDDVYVLEYTNANGGQADGWTPRVRKLARDGRVTTLATLARAPSLERASSFLEIGCGAVMHPAGRIGLTAWHS
jgi:sugar lactone lactonase YvrE